MKNNIAHLSAVSYPLHISPADSERNPCTRRTRPNAYRYVSRAPPPARRRGLDQTRLTNVNFPKTTPAFFFNPFLSDCSSALADTTSRLSTLKLEPSSSRTHPYPEPNSLDSCTQSPYVITEMTHLRLPSSASGLAMTCPLIWWLLSVIPWLPIAHTTHVHPQLCTRLTQ